MRTKSWVLSSPLKISLIVRGTLSTASSTCLATAVRCTGNCITIVIFYSSNNIWENNEINAFFPKTQCKITACIHPLFLPLIPSAVGLHQLNVQYKASCIWTKNRMSKNLQRKEGSAWPSAAEDKPPEVTTWAELGRSAQLSVTALRARSLHERIKPMLAQLSLSRLIIWASFSKPLNAQLNQEDWKKNK